MWFGNRFESVGSGSCVRLTVISTCLDWVQIVVRLKSLLNCHALLILIHLQNIWVLQALRAELDGHSLNYQGWSLLGLRVCQTWMTKPLVQMALLLKRKGSPGPLVLWRPQIRHLCQSGFLSPSSRIWLWPVFRIAGWAKLQKWPDPGELLSPGQRELMAVSPGLAAGTRLGVPQLCWPCVGTCPSLT